MSDIPRALTPQDCVEILFEHLEVFLPVAPASTGDEKMKILSAAQIALRDRAVMRHIISIGLGIPRAAAEIHDGFGLWFATVAVLDATTRSQSLSPIIDAIFDALRPYYIPASQKVKAGRHLRVVK